MAVVSDRRAESGAIEHDGFRKGTEGETSFPRCEVQERPVEDVGTLLGASTQEPSKYRRDSLAFGDALELAITVSYRGHLLSVDEGMDDRLEHIRKSWSDGKEVTLARCRLYPHLTFVTKPL